MSASRCTAATRAASSLAMAVRTQPRLERLALIAPQQGVNWTYGELDQRCRSLARGLREVGVAKGSFAVSDLPNVCENLVLQLALAHLGASIATVKDAEGLAKLCDRETVCVALSSSRSSFLASAELKAPPIILAESSDEDIKPGSLLFQEVSSAPADTADALAREDGLMGVYNGASLTHGTALSLARDAAAHLQTTPDDRACVSITLCHAFGIGSATGSALSSGAAVVLPAVGGIRGCGDPKQRAAVTLEVLRSAAATQLFADTHTLRAFPETSDATLALRTGVVKIGSGSDFLDSPTYRFAGVTLHSMGKAAAKPAA